MIRQRRREDLRIASNRGSGWPFADGIHHTTAGYAVRNEAIAKALVGFWPP